ncbi:MAG: hypothetical protein ACPG21_13310 [Crocinitomicaceae bacterium]
MTLIKFKSNGYSAHDFLQDESLKAIAFEYLIPLPFAWPLRLETKVEIVDPKQEAKLRRRVNTRNFVFSIVGLPFAPFFAAMARKINKDGFDRTLDLRENAIPDDFNAGRIYIERIVEHFFSPDKAVIRGVKKSIKRYFEHQHTSFFEIYLGEYVYGGANNYYIGLPSRLMTDMETIRNYLSKEFMKNIHFTFIDLDNDAQYADHIRQQGVRMFEGKKRNR